jgi:hypothetical protein
VVAAGSARSARRVVKAAVTRRCTSDRSLPRLKAAKPADLVLELKKFVEESRAGVRTGAVKLGFGCTKADRNALARKGEVCEGSASAPELFPGIRCSSIATLWCTSSGR